MASPSSLKSSFVKLEWENKLFTPFYDRTQNHNRVLPIYIEGASSEQSPDFLKPIYGFSYRGPQDEELIKRLADQVVNTHGKAA
jgi:hypothetical protein